MKRCPDCRRDYYDDSLMYCLDDGAALLEGPSSGNEQATAFLPSNSFEEAPTKAIGGSRVEQLKLDVVRCRRPPR